MGAGTVSGGYIARATQLNAGHWPVSGPQIKGWVFRPPSEFNFEQRNYLENVNLLTTIDLGLQLASFWYSNRWMGPPTPSALNFEQRNYLENTGHWPVYGTKIKGWVVQTRLHRILSRGTIWKTLNPTAKEDRKARRREYYAKNVERLREQSRIRMAEQRAAVKAKRRKSDILRRSSLTTAERTASKALTEMLEKKAARLAAQSDEVDSEAEPEQDSGIEGCVPQSDSRMGAASIMSDAETTIDREIGDLVEQVVEVERTESEPSESEEEGDDGGSATNSNVTPVSAHQIRAQALKYQSLRLSTPTPNSPSPEPEGPMPSLYEKLWFTVEKRQRR
ncbi:hypothetical protein B0H13DRAFT_1860667 [Mycena leptocephala]|nr:hypothetical protein B0H13DRAFT_1860667 [Mycena leptocephala]